MRFQLIFILFHLFWAKDPFKVYVETISANDRCIDICIDLQWVVKCNFDDDDDGSFSQVADIFMR